MDPKNLLYENKHLLDLIDQNSFIDPSLYAQYHVKQGLRNENGTGVLVGITRVAGVYGYDVVDGVKVPQEGNLVYRGIQLSELVEGFQSAKRPGFEETTFLLLFGKLPTATELAEFESVLTQLRSFPKHFTEDIFFKVPSRDIMNKLQRVILSLYSYDEFADDTSLANVTLQSLNLIAKMPMMLAYAYRSKRHYFDGTSLIIHNPQPQYGTAENLLHMLRENKTFEPWEAELLDLCLVVHAEHGGGNNSAFTTHVVSSSGTDTYAAIAAAVGSLKGPKHGGASIKVVEMIDDIQANCDWKDENALRDYLHRILNGEAFDHSGLIYGMGHAVYTLSDPRVVLLREKAQELAGQAGMEDELLLLNRIETIAKELHCERKGNHATLCANVDLYSGFVYKMLSLPRGIYTPLFAVARTTGWCAHRLEQIRDKKIMRPAYVTLSENMPYLSMEQRV